MATKPTSTHRRFFTRPSSHRTSKRTLTIYPAGQFYFCRSIVPIYKRTSQMSSITPLSFVDDGSSFIERTPHGLASTRVTDWISRTESDTSTYTGSFIDDGADLLTPPFITPGFGLVDPKLYKQSMKRYRKDAIWNTNMQKAISGDIQRNLSKIQDLGRLEVRREGENIEKDRKKDTVTVRTPLKWGTFVINAEEGRVIVIDRDGEFDSGPRMDKVERPARWINAPSSIASCSLADLPYSLKCHGSLGDFSDHTRETDKEMKQDHSRTHKKTHHKHLHPPAVKPLPPIHESEYEFGCQSSVSEDIVPPSQFLMTGGVSGWPSRTTTTITSPASSITESYHFMPPSSINHIHNSTPRFSLDEWLSSPHFSPESITESEQSQHNGNSTGLWRKDLFKCSHRNEMPRQLRRGRSHMPSRHDLDNASTRTYLTYKAPTVEDAPDTSSDDMKEYGNDNSAKNSSGHKNESQASWRGFAKVATEQSRVISERNREKSRRAHTRTANDGSPASGQTARNKHSPGSTRESAASKGSWDGYERVKTISEVSNADSDSERERSSVGSQASSRHSARASSRGRWTSQANSERRCQTDWWDNETASIETSNTQKAQVDDNGWEGSLREGEDGWEGSQRSANEGWKGSLTESDDRVGVYANGYDEDNETYLNENWGGTPVRVGSWWTSVAGWS